MLDDRDEFESEPTRLNRELLERREREAKSDNRWRSFNLGLVVFSVIQFIGIVIWAIGRSL